MTGWHITLGYASSYGEARTREGAEQLLETLAYEVADHILDILDEVKRTNVSREDEDGVQLFTYARKYQIRDDSFITISTVTNAVGDVVETSIVLLASGGGISRTMKEHLHRAYCRLLMMEMHRHGLDIQISVA